MKWAFFYSHQKENKISIPHFMYSCMKLIYFLNSQYLNSYFEKLNFEHYSWLKEKNEDLFILVQFCNFSVFKIKHKTFSCEQNCLYPQNIWHLLLSLSVLPTHHHVFQLCRYFYKISGILKSQCYYSEWYIHYVKFNLWINFVPINWILV